MEQARQDSVRNRCMLALAYDAALPAYLVHRRDLSRNRGSLFLSESHRNHAEPISL